MDIIEKVLDLEIETMGDLQRDKLCFFDIETTGLNRRVDRVYLVGLVYYSNIANSYILKQIFIDSLDKEDILLEELNKILKDFQTLITFNGDNFDLPFIKYRMKKYDIDVLFNDSKSFDIYRQVRANNSYLNLPSLKLKELEKLLGIFREDKYSGKDCIGFYFNYIETGQEDLKEKILQHNYDDLYYLPQVIKILDYIEEKKSLDILLRNKKIRITIDRIDFKGDIFTINAITDKTLDKYDLRHYGDVNILWTSKGDLTIQLEAKRGYITPSRKAIFASVKNLSFLSSLKDSSEYMTPDNVILLKVQNIFEMDNLKNIIREIMNIFEE